MNSRRSKKLTNPLLSIHLFFPIQAISPRGMDKITTELSKELFNYTEEIKGKVLLEMLIKQDLSIFFVVEF